MVVRHIRERTSHGLIAPVSGKRPVEAEHKKSDGRDRTCDSDQHRRAPRCPIGPTAGLIASKEHPFIKTGKPGAPCCTTPFLRPVVASAHSPSFHVNAKLERRWIGLRCVTLEDSAVQKLTNCKGLLASLSLEALKRVLAWLMSVIVKGQGWILFSRKLLESWHVTRQPKGIRDT